MKNYYEKQILPEAQQATDDINQWLKPAENKKPTASYPFVDLIRFISMMGIVWAHIDVSPPGESFQSFLSNIDYVKVYLPYMQIFKFSLICFFLISGFLLGDKIGHTDPVTYYKKRFRAIVKPYLVAVIIVALIVFTRTFILHRYDPQITSLGSIIYFCLFESHLWYIPNYLICLLILLIFNKSLNKKALGIGLFLITLTYAVLTVYTKHFALSHTYALFGYVFYLWLGVYIRQNNIVDRIYSVKTWVWVTLTITAFVLSSIECYWLYKFDLNVFSILRIFNQLYSVCMFALLIKLCRTPPKFRFFNPRKETYGIYLYHAIIMWYILPKIIIWLDKYFNIHLYTHRMVEFIPLAIADFAITYLATTILVKLLIRFNLGYLKTSQ